MKLYTKTGDFGTSSLYNGSRKHKSSGYFHVLGDIDELNSFIGVVKSLINENKLNSLNEPNILKDIQCTLMDISSFIATPPWDIKHPIVGDTEEHILKWKNRIGLSPDLITEIEKRIDNFDNLLPTLTNFVVPGNNVLVSYIHVCRTISRRCERSFLELLSSELEYYGVYNSVDEQFKIVQIYLNRLSDFFFVFSRFTAMYLHVEEDRYSRNKKV